MPSGFLVGEKKDQPPALDLDGKEESAWSSENRELAGTIPLLPAVGAKTPFSTVRGRLNPRAIVVVLKKGERLGFSGCAFSGASLVGFKEKPRGNRPLFGGTLSSCLRQPKSTSASWSEQARTQPYPSPRAGRSNSLTRMAG